MNYTVALLLILEVTELIVLIGVFSLIVNSETLREIFRYELQNYFKERNK